MKRSLIVVAVLVLLSVAVWLTLQYFKSKLDETEVRQIQQALQQGAIVLDVRTTREFKGGHIDGALNIPIGQLSEKLGGLDRQRTLVVYCRSGHRSTLAAKLLQEKGFQVLNLKTMGNWKSVQNAL